ncbi:MAG: ABC transporter substrate-binding protein [Ruminococcus sp.]|nr:ABC transporter substrate-binding protein [Ruminococcus sp.]
MKKILAVLLAIMLVASLAACGGSGTSTATKDSAAVSATYTIGICNYVDHPSLNQIVESVKTELEILGEDNNVEFKILEENANADADVMNQIIANFIAENVDLMVGIATPVAMAMQSATEGTDIPVVFAAVSDPEAVSLIGSMEAPGANITGTSDYLNTNAIIDLIFAANPDTEKVGLLYDLGQDASTGAIEEAKVYLTGKGVEIVEQTGTTAEEVKLAAQALADDKVDAVFTPTDNTIQECELSIYEIFTEAGIPHYAGADSFALNGAFLGYGVDYVVLGTETANTVVDILIDGADPATTAVKTFDNGIATVNTETAEALGFDLDEIKAAFEPHCTQIVEIQTAEEF